MSEAQVTELAKSKRAGSTTSFYSNEAGFITGLDIKEGDYVAEGGTVLRLADLSVLWAEAQVYASQLSFIDLKSEALVRFPGLPGLLLKGRIEFVNPEISPGSRINLVRVSLPNTGGLLKPGMQATVTLESPKYKGLSLPVEAVLRDSRGALVWTATGINTFQYKMVATGVEDNDRIEIKSGLEPGDRVVVSGAYLLNSEFIFRNGISPR
jgi:Cu(I)/Ag(I) efflux system membrane fusion protein